MGALGRTRRVAESVGGCVLSVVSSVSLVVVNKHLISNVGFSYVTTLTGAHLVFTWAFLSMQVWLGQLEPKKLDATAMLKFGCLNGVSLGLLNLCLAYNSVGFYQMAKLAIIPCTVLLQSTFFGKRFASTVVGSLGVLVLGIGVATVSDVELNAFGSIIAVLAIVATCVAQILTGELQRTCGCSSTQLLHKSSPIMAVTLLIIGVPLDAKLSNGGSILDFDFTSHALTLVTLSCLIAVAVNFSTFFVIGRLSTVTYQVLGHLKTCLILGSGFLIFGNETNARNLSGIALAVVGMVAYAHFELQEKKRLAAQSESLPVNQK